MKQGYGSEQTMAALQKTTLNIHCRLQLKIDIKKYNNVHLVLNKTKYRLYNQKPNKLSVVQAETKQKISCTRRNKTKDQLYKQCCGYLVSVHRRLFGMIVAVCEHC